MNLRTAGSLSSLALVVLVAPQLAYAQQDVEKQVTRMNKKAMEDYDSLEFESARRTLIDAVAILRSNGLDETPLAAKTFLNLGILYIAGFKDKTRGQQQFVNALKIKPDVKLDPAIATPELEEAFQGAQKQVGARPRPVEPSRPVEPTKPAEPAKPPVEEVHGLQHNPVDESRPSTPVPIRAQLGNDVGATRVFLFYRSAGQEDYVSVPMKNTGGADWVAVIPPDAVVGRALQYYLEARDQRGRPVVGSGSGPNPYIISINEGAAAPTNVPEIDVEDPLRAERARRAREAEERRGKPHRWFAFVMLGTGFGYEPAGNHTEVAWQFDPTGDQYVRQNVGAGGVAFSPLHVGVEVGAFVAKGFALSAVGRFQVYTAANAETQLLTGEEVAATKKATGAVAGLLRAKYRFLDGRVKPYIHVDIGGGQIRHLLNVSADPMVAEQADYHPLVDGATAATYNGGDKAAAMSGRTTSLGGASGIQRVCANDTSCSDTIVLGDLLVGGGVGLWIDVHKYLALILDVNLLGAVGVGGGQSGMNIDVNFGFGAHF